MKRLVYTHHCMSQITVGFVMRSDGKRFEKLLKEIKGDPSEAYQTYLKYEIAGSKKYHSEDNNQTFEEYLKECFKIYGPNLIVSEIKIER